MRKACILLILVSTPVCSHRTEAQSRAIVSSTAIKFDGTAPPLHSIYTCIQELRGRPYSQDETQKCVDRIKESNYFESVSATPRPLEANSMRLEFHLKAPALKIVELQYGISQLDKETLQAYLKKNGSTIGMGEVYDSAAQGMALQRMQQFFASEGRHVAISSRVVLDYRARTAQVQFKFFEGPRGPKESRFLVQNSGCKDEIEELNLTDVDDFVPLPLVEAQMKLRAFSCFDHSLAREDEAALQRTGLFRVVRFHVRGAQGARRVLVEIQGKPVTVSRVNVVGYGLIQHGPIENLGELPLKANDAYKGSAALRTLDHLARLYQRHGRRVDVLQDVRQVRGENVEVTFSVLVYDDDELCIDGQLYRERND
jgi:outer membrane protein assembly factor BamA